MIASRLRAGARSTILGLGDTYCILGCAEPTAIRLSKPAASRPALTEMIVDPVEGKMFRLTPFGVQVKIVFLEEQDRARLGDALDAIEFHLSGGADEPRSDFLHAWNEGDISEWPEYADFLASRHR